MYLKNVAIAQITDPQEVEQECINRGWLYDLGAIFVSIPEIGFEGINLIYCRYGLSIPYIRIQEGWKLLVEPTIADKNDSDNRWFYTGIVDCGGSTGVTPDTDMQMLIQLVTQVIYASGTQLFLSKQDADEPLVLGNALQTWIEDFITNVFNAHTHTTTATIGDSSVVGVISTPTPTGTAPSDILSEKVFTE